ncbi:MAG: hypothetical protein KAJ62_13600 [Desulfobacteraceae bacterium]|nr:hypothetical protein [Desulfobacteraceae bacterium]
MKKQVSKKVIIFFIVLCLLMTPTLGFAHGGGSGGGGGGSVQLAVNTVAILTTIVFVLWTTVFMSAILRHSVLKSKVFSNPNRNKVFMMPLTGFLGLNQLVVYALMSNPAAVMALSYPKQRPTVASMWSGKISYNPIVTDGQSKGLVSSVEKEDESFAPIYIRTKIQF